MSALLDEDTIVLDQTVLEGEPSCQSANGCTEEADWACVMRCCGFSASLCSYCLNLSRTLADGHSITCRDCGHHFGVARYELIVRTNPL